MSADRRASKDRRVSFSQSTPPEPFTPVVEAHRVLDMSSNNCRGTYLSENNNEFILHNRRFSKSSLEKSDRTESTRISTRAIDRDKTSNQSSLSYARRFSISDGGRASGTVYSSRRSRISTNVSSD